MPLGERVHLVMCNSGSMDEGEFVQQALVWQQHRRTLTRHSLVGLLQRLHERARQRGVVVREEASGQTLRGRGWGGGWQVHGGGGGRQTLG